MPKTHIFWWFRIKKTVFLWKNLHFVVCNSFIYDRIEFNSFAKDVKYNHFTEYLDCNAQQRHCRVFVLKTWNFHCTRRAKNWEFQILQIINFLKTTKMIPECRDLLRLLVCASWSCIGVSCTCRDIAITTLRIYMPPPHHPPIKKMDHRKYSENLIFQSRFSCWFWELFELLMALKWSLRSPLSFCSIV